MTAVSSLMAISTQSCLSLDECKDRQLWVEIGLMSGTIFSRKGNFGRNKARLVQQARKAMFYVLRKARKLSLPIDILLQLFDAMVASILFYGAEVWGYEKNDIAETLHLEFCKYTLGHKLGTTKFEMENIFYITLFSC